MAKANSNEKTGAQLPSNVMISYDGKLNLPQRENWYRKVRMLRCDPTISLLRGLFIAPILAANWTIESTGDVPQGAEDVIEEEVFRWRNKILRTGALGCIDYGWQPFEKVYKMRSDGFYGIKKIKPLLQELTEIMVIESTGEFDGFVQDIDGTGDKRCDLESSMLLNFDVEGTNWYGCAPMLASEMPYDQCCVIGEAASRYDQKTAGAHWIVYYPNPGKTLLNGVETDNHQVALSLLNSLRASGGAVLPREVGKFMDDMENSKDWEIKLISADGSVSASYTDRCKYYDNLKARALGFPERAVLEGTFGTKAEAGEHGDFALTGIELRHGEIAEAVNEQLVAPLVSLNWGEQFAYRIQIKPSPIKDYDKECALRIFEKLLADPGFLLETIDAVDGDALRQAVGLATEQVDLPEVNRLLEGN